MNYNHINNYLYNLKPEYEGIYSCIYKGYSIKNKDTPLVIKKIKKNIYKKYIQEELIIMKELYHVNVLPLLDAFYKKKKLYLVLNYCNGGNLKSYIHSSETKYNKKYIYEIIDGFTYLYSKNILHRDIKPENILIHDNTIKICDFGLSKTMNLDSINHSICGTPNYIAPELYKFNIYNRASDMWSLGVILYEIIHKEHPYVCKNYGDLILTLKTSTTNAFENVGVEKNNETEIFYIIQKMLIIDYTKRLEWTELIQFVKSNIYIQINNTKPIKKSQPITIQSINTIQHTSNNYRSRSSSVSNNKDSNKIINQHNTYSMSAPTMNLSNSCNSNYIDNKVHEQVCTIKKNNSTSNLNYHTILGETVQSKSPSYFSYYYNKFLKKK
jgi:serine/threonine-protein kinase ULK/ATG1